MVAEDRDPAMVAGDLVELVAVQHQVAIPVGCDVHVVHRDADVAERGADVLARGFVVVSGDEDHLDMVTRALQELLQQRVLRRRPVDAARLHRPEVEDVADEVQLVRLVGLQEVQQPLGLARRGAEMDVGEEDRSDPRRQRRPALHPTKM